MNTPALFDTADDADDADPGKPRQPAEPWIVDELVTLGVERGKAEGYTLRQAFAVRAKLKKKAEAAARNALRPGLIEPESAGAAGPLDRAVVAAALGEVLADHVAGKAGPDELYRSLRGSLYVLSDAETVRVAKGLILLLGGGT